MSSMRDDVVRIGLEETSSVIDVLRSHRGEEGRLFTVVTADYQTAGRGQGTNTWESERGKNLLFAVRTRRLAIDAGRQFVLAEAMALAVRDALETVAGGFSVKWPNDVYWHDRKISGTLTDCDLQGRSVRSCIWGTGINVNQREFVSDAPNPVALRSVIGREADREALLWNVLDALAQRLAMANGGQADRLHRQYLDALYRREGFHRYRDAGGEFAAAIETVAADGHLVLRRDDGRLQSYAFKEVAFV